MSLEKYINQEQLSENKEKLLSYEKEGKYVFHGSVLDLESLEPRQAYNNNEETGEMGKDGEPAVFATPHAEVAIFRALINSSNAQGEEASNFFGKSDNSLYFSATKNLFEYAKSKNGKVYVLEKKNFSDPEGIECVSNELVSPVEVIEVDFNDLPKDIKIIPLGDK